MNKLIFGDCLIELSNIENNSIDMILCDLPYEFTNCSWDNMIKLEDYVIIDNHSPKNTKYLNKDEYLLYFLRRNKSIINNTDLFFEKNKKVGLWSHYKRILKENGVIVLNGIQPFSSKLVNTNLKMYKYSWIWNKVNRFTGALNANKIPMLDYEEILVFYDKQPTFNKQLREGNYITRHTKGNRNSESYNKSNIQKDVGRKVNGLNPKRILDIPAHNTDKDKTFHPTQKPVELGEYLIKTYSNEGNTVLDNCCGSGSYLVAAKNLNRKYIGIDNGYCKKDKIINGINIKGLKWVEISKLRLDGML